MPKVKLDIESDLSEVYTAFGKGDELINQASVNVKSFGKDANTAFKSATVEADKFGKEVQDGTKQIGELGKSTEIVGKSANKLKELKNQVKDLTGEAIRLKQLGDYAGSNEAIKKVGELKDEIKDVQDAIKAVAGNAKENFANAIGSATSVAAQGFEAATAASSLFGEKNEEVEKQLLKLQAIQSLSRIAAEFGDIGDKIDAVKLGLAPLTNGLKTLYTSGNAGLLKLKNEGLNFSSILPGIKSFFTGFGSGIKNLVSSGIAGFKSLFAVIAANPLAIILIVITAVIGAMVALRDKVKPIGVLFEAIGDAINKIGEDLEKFGQLLGIVADASEKRAKASIKNSEDELAAIRERYDFEIALAEASGKSTKKAEQEKFKAVEDRLKQTLSSLLYLAAVNGKASEEEIKQYKDTKKELVKINQEATIAIAKEATEARKKADEDAKKAQEEAKKAAEKRKALAKDLADFLLELAKKSDAAEIELLSGEEKIFAQRKAAQQEIDLLRETLIKKQIAAGKGNKISADQQAEFANLELLANKQQAEALVKLETEKANKIAAERRKQTDDEIKFLDTKTKLAIAQIEGLKNTTGLSEADFEKVKQEEILRIQIDAYNKSLEAKKEQIKNQEGLTKEQIDAETDLLVQETKNQIDRLNKELEKLSEKPKFSLAKLLGLTPEELQKTIQGVLQFTNQITELANSFIQGEQDKLDNELKLNEERVQARETNIDDLKSQLSEELDLQRQGLANNVDSLKEQIAAQEQARLQDLENDRKIKEEKKKLAKQQFALDTAAQALNLLTASTEIFKTYSGIPFVGIPLAVGLIATMLGVFIKTKSNALAAINAGGFKEGGYTGGTSTNEERGPVHGMEFVHTAEKTKKNRNLFEGIHKDDKILIHKGILELIDGKGISLEPDLPMNLASKKDNLRILTHNNSFVNINSGMEKRMDFLNSQVNELTKKLNNKTTVMPDGTIIKESGNVTRIIRKK